MCDIQSQGFCDLNISTDIPNLKSTVVYALKLGYETIAINTEVSDQAIISKKNKKDRYAAIPPPTKISLTMKEWEKCKSLRKPSILSRLTIRFSDPSSPFLHKSKEVLGKYDMIAYVPLSEAAFKYLCQPSIDVDIISFDVTKTDYRPSRNLLRYAIKSDIYFEICYAPCIRSSSYREKTIQFAQELYTSCRSRNVVLTSGAKQPSELRNPYDVSCIGFLFCLTHTASRAAVSKTALDLVYCARLRRTGCSKCSPQVIFSSTPPNKGKYSSLVALEKVIAET